MFVVWRVSEVRNPHNTLDAAIAEARTAIANESCDEAIVLRVLKKVSRKEPKVQVVVRNYTK